MLRVVRAEEHLEPWPPVVVGGAHGVEAEHFGSRTEQRRRVSEPRELLVKQWTHCLGVELARQPQPRNEGPIHAAIMPSASY